MQATPQELYDWAMNLSDSERLQLATMLLNSVTDDLALGSLDDSEFADELDRREDDGAAAIPWAQAQAKLRADLEGG